MTKEIIKLKCIANQFDHFNSNSLIVGKMYNGYYTHTGNITLQNGNKVKLDYYKVLGENTCYGSCYFTPVSELREEKINKIYEQM